MRERIIDYIKETYHIDPIYPWKLQPGYAVLCHKNSLKWFAMIMNVEGSRLGLTEGKILDVINLRVPEEEVALALQKPGFLPAYHMAVNEWVTILLDHTVSEEEIKEMIQRSYQLTMEEADRPSGRGKTAGSTGRNESGRGRGSEGVIYYGGRYKDQPLPAGRWQQEESLPEKIREMKRLARSTGSGLEEYYFYKQALFMADYEDDFRYEGYFIRFYPTYQKMTTDQLRGYFGWRTRYRKGTVELEQLSYIYVYLYELLCKIGCASPQEGFAALRKLDRDFGDKDQVLKEKILAWSRDYVIYYGLDPALLADLETGDLSDSLSVLTRFEEGIRAEREEDLPSQEEVFSALCSAASYNLTTSAFYKKYPDLMQEGAVRVFQELCRARRDRKMTLMKKCFGIRDKYLYRMFYGAVFYQARKPEDHVYKINEALEFECKDGKWYCRSFARMNEKNRELGNICHEIDRQMRLQHDFKGQLKSRLEEKAAAAQIERAIREWIAEKKEAEKPAIVIDFSRLSKIRSDAEKTRDQLIVEEEDESAAPVLPEETFGAGGLPEEQEEAAGAGDLPEEQEEAAGAGDLPEEPEESAGAGNLPPGLTEDHAGFLRLLMRGGSWQEYLTEHRLMLSILVDEINEAFYDEIGDTVLEFDGSEPMLVEDYLDEIKEYF